MAAGALSAAGLFHPCHEHEIAPCLKVVWRWLGLDRGFFRFLVFFFHGVKFVQADLSIADRAFVSDFFMLNWVMVRRVIADNDFAVKIRAAVISDAF